MNSRERVIRAINFQHPDRLPVIFHRFGQSDVHYIGWNQIGTGPRELKESVDEWNCTWVRSEINNMGQVKGHPLADWAALDSFRWPDPHSPDFYTGMEQQFEGSEDKYIATGIFMLLFERMHALHGFQNVLEDLILEREKIEFLADRIVEFDLAIIEEVSQRFPGQIQGFTFTDDWGSQKDAFISPRTWRDFFMPRYQKIVSACKRAGWHIWMHSCGKINKLIPDILSTGIDVLNLEQPRILGIEEIGQAYAGKVCFSSGCDIQQTLPFKDEAEIRAEARLLLNCWGTPAGGFILADDGNDQDLGTPAIKKEFAYQAFLEFDPWKPGGAFSKEEVKSH